VVAADIDRAAAPHAVAEHNLLPFAAGTFDLVVAPWSLHWVDDLPGALIEARRVLAPDGLLLANLPALGSLGELRDALIAAEAAAGGGVAPRVSPFAALSDGAGLLQRAGFALPVADLDTLHLSYAEPLALLAELRACGETNSVLARARRPLRRGVVADALRRLPRGADGRVAVTLAVLTLTGWAPAPGQQAPLRPGSAAARLADALGGVEHAAGEAAGPPQPGLLARPAAG
jgi:SAM-dependent methyltransferase